MQELINFIRRKKLLVIIALIILTAIIIRFHILFYIPSEGNIRRDYEKYGSAFDCVINQFSEYGESLYIDMDNIGEYSDVECLDFILKKLKYQGIRISPDGTVIFTKRSSFGGSSSGLMFTKTPDFYHGQHYLHKIKDDYYTYVFVL